MNGEYHQAYATSTHAHRWAWLHACAHHQQAGERHPGQHATVCARTTHLAQAHEMAKAVDVLRELGMDAAVCL